MLHKSLVSPQAPEGPHANELVPPQVDKVDKSVSIQVFEGGPLELLLLPLYSYHIVRHIWDGDVKLVGFILFKLCLLL